MVASEAGRQTARIGEQASELGGPGLGERSENILARIVGRLGRCPGTQTIAATRNRLQERHRLVSSVLDKTKDAEIIPLKLAHRAGSMASDQGDIMIANSRTHNRVPSSPPL